MATYVFEGCNLCCGWLCAHNDVCLPIVLGERKIGGANFSDPKKTALSAKFTTTTSPAISKGKQYTYTSNHHGPTLPTASTTGGGGGGGGEGGGEEEKEHASRFCSSHSKHNTQSFPVPHFLFHHNHPLSPLLPCHFAPPYQNEESPVLLLFSFALLTFSFCAFAPSSALPLSPTFSGRIRGA